MSQSILKIEPYATDNTANFVFNGLTVTSNISSGNANLGNVVTANYYYGNGVNLTGIVATSANFANYAGNVTVGSQGNITSVGTLSGLTATGIINLTGASNVSLGAVGNVKITGGSSSQYLQTDGTGNLSWATVSLSSASISNGTSNVSIPASGGNVNISVAGNANVLVTTGSGVNVSGSLNATGNANVGNLGATGVVATTVAGALTTQSQPNVTSVGTLSGLVVNGNTTLIGNLVVTGNTTFVNSNITDLQDPLIQLGTGANGATLGGNLGVDIGAVLNYYNSAAQTAFMGWKTANADFEFVSNATVNSNNVITVNTLGNIRAGNANLGNAVTSNYFIGSGNNLSNIQASNITGSINANVSNYEAVTTQTTGIFYPVFVNGNTNGNYALSSNTLLSFDAANSILTTGSIAAGTGTGGNITGANYISANYFQGNGSLLTGIGGAAYISNGTSNVNIPASSGNITVGVAGTSNVIVITSTGINVAGNANISGNANVGNLGATGVVATTLGGSLTTASQGNITSVGTLSSLTVTANITGGNANLGNLVTANYFTGTLTTNAQPNITSVGTLASLTVTSNITGGNANLGNLVTANYFSGAGNNLSNIQGGNVTGQVGNALVAGTVYTNAQPNITSVGTLTSLTVSGLLTATGTGIKVANIQDSTGTITIATKYGGSAGDVGITGNLTVGTSGTGNITSVNANLGNAVTANYFVGNGQYITSVAAVTAATVTASAQPNITSVGTLANLIVGNSTANTTFGNGTITATGNISFTGANVSLGAVGNIKITGGTAGYFLSTDGNGNLSWGAASGGGGGATASGSNTQIQYNNAGVLGASANLTFNNTSNTLTVDRAVHINGANLGSNIANIYIGGGSANQILKTDGVGNLSWIAQPSTTITVDTFTGDGTTTAFTLSVTPTNINQTIVNYNGVFQLRTSAYTISGSTITFTEAPLNNSKIEVTTTIGVMSGGGAFTNRTYTGTGSQTAYTVTSGVTASSLLVTENGVVQTPGTDYTVSGSTLTFTTAPTANMTIQIRELAVAVASVSGVPITVQNQGSNLTTTANLFNFTGSGVTATNSGNNVTVTVPGGLSNARAFGFSLVFGG